MKLTIINRLAVASAMGIFLLLGLAYWWLDNLPHEIFGTAMFVLLARHIFVNRHWFRRLLRGHYDGRRVVATALHLGLVINMAVLLVTSIAISKSVFGFLSIHDSISVREVHWFSAYWVMIVVGLHVGIHWRRVMALLRSGLGLSENSVVRTFVLRAVATLVAGFGAWSFSVLGVWAKLTFTYSLDFWDFGSSVTPFFGYWIGVVSLPAIAAHYAIAPSRVRGRLSDPRRDTARSMRNADAEGNA